MPDTAGPGRPGPAGGPRHAAPDDTPHVARPAAALPRVPGRARHRQRSWWSGPFARGSLLALVLTASVVMAALVTWPAGDGGTPAAPPPSATPAPGGPAPAEWLAAALPRSTDLAASAGVREDLTGQGVPADRLRPAEDDDATGSLLAVVGPAPPGSRVVARFDRPGDGDELLVVDPRPGEPTAEQRERRWSLAAALLANPTTGADPAVVAVLQSGEVDLRLLSLLAALAADEGVGIAALPPLPGEEGTATPARRVLLDSLGGAPVPADPAATERLQGWLAAQLPPFTPDDVQVGDDGVLVSFHYVSAPDALVAEATR